MGGYACLKTLSKTLSTLYKREMVEFISQTSERVWQKRLRWRAHFANTLPLVNHELAQFRCREGVKNHEASNVLGLGQ